MGKSSIFSSVKEFIQLETRIGPECAGQRLDQALAAAWADYSRSMITGWIRAGAVEVDGRAVKPNFRLGGGEHVTLGAEIRAREDNPEPEAIALDIRYRDDDVFVINKPPGLVVHPGSGNPAGTLVNALLHVDPGLASLPRAGLVHRLDKDTSGCLVVARNLKAHNHLIRAMKKRLIKRHYQALVWGEVIAGGTIDAAIDRHPVDRRKQVVTPRGREAVTHYRVARRVAGGTLLDVRLETGRTHQIRVHLTHIGFPIVGDPVYGRRGSPAGLSDAQREAWRRFGRQALHAAELAFPSPGDGVEVAVSAPMPEDFRELLEVLQLVLPPAAER